SEAASWSSSLPSPGGSHAPPVRHHSQRSACPPPPDKPFSVDGRVVHVAPKSAAEVSSRDLRPVTPNSSFKPNPLRSTNNMAGKACHVAGSTTRVGLTQVLGSRTWQCWRP